MIGLRLRAPSRWRWLIAGFVALITLPVGATSLVNLSHLASIQTSASASQTALPLDHIFTVMMENESFDNVLGSPDAPYISALADANGLASNYHGITHPSVNNYTGSVSGQIYPNITDGCTPGTGTCSTNATNIADGIEASGRSWKAYMENMPSPCYTKWSSPDGLYVAKHNPFVYFNDIRNDPARCDNIVPYTQFGTDLAAASFHPTESSPASPESLQRHVQLVYGGSRITQGDNWLAAQSPQDLPRPQRS